MTFGVSPHPQIGRSGAARQSVDPARPAGPQILAALRVAILRMDYAPGCRLSEAEIGERFGASRTPVREAFMALRDADLVTTYASRGTFVTLLNAQRIREAQFLREALELATVRRLATNGLAAAHAERALGNLDAQRSAVATADDVRFQQLDDELHLLLAEATGHGRVVLVLAREKTQLDRLRVLSLRDSAHRLRLLDEHVSLIEAIEARDADGALDIARLHLRSILDMLESMSLTHGDYFEAPATDRNTS